MSKRYKRRSYQPTKVKRKNPINEYHYKAFVSVSKIRLGYSLTAYVKDWNKVRLVKRQEGLL